ncbi:MAG: M20/M25/M40 family metallo-hydrolase [Anaerolineae bacterium]|jgi:putative selenium metabolism hydrolase
MDYGSLWRAVQAQREALVGFAQALVQTQSPSGHEGDVAARIRAEMERLGYDEGWADEAGNVVGRIAGGPGLPLMLNGHMDHVDAGDPVSWAHPPFGGAIHDGELWGRGAADMKGALAAMVYAGGVARALDMPLPGDLYVSGVVQEEVGGLGARYMAGSLPLGRVVIGEASGNQLRRGHRGRVELNARFEGRSVHASMPDLGVNPIASLIPFLRGLATLPMIAEPPYGRSTVAVTRLESEPESTNITPSMVRAVLDWRNVPGETPADIITTLEALLAGSLAAGCTGKIEVSSRELETYTGLRMRYPDVFPSFTTPADHPWLAQAQAALAVALGREVEVGTWRFATDGGHFAAAGATVIGLGPGDDTVVHTVEERLPVDELVEAVMAYALLAVHPWE